MFERQAERPGEAGLLVRVNAGRQRKVQVWDEGFGAVMIRAIEAQPDFEQPLVTGRKIKIDSQGGRRARPQRTATTEIRIGQVQVRPPQKRKAAAPLTCWLVRVLETDPPAGEAPLEWLLLSSEGGRTAEWAERIVDRRLRDAQALGKCLAFDAITAWRVFSLERYARDAPETPAEEVLTADELAVIEQVAEAEQVRPPRERGQPVGPGIRNWVVLLARIAGWHPSKRQPLPGNEVLWRAYRQLQMMVRYRQAVREPP